MKINYILKATSEDRGADEQEKSSSAHLMSCKNVKKALKNLKSLRIKLQDKFRSIIHYKTKHSIKTF